MYDAQLAQLVVNDLAPTFSILPQPVPQVEVIAWLLRIQTRLQLILGAGDSARRFLGHLRRHRARRQVGGLTHCRATPPAPTLFANATRLAVRAGAAGQERSVEVRPPPRCASAKRRAWAHRDDPARRAFGVQPPVPCLHGCRWHSEQGQGGQGCDRLQRPHWRIALVAYSMWA